ncbi:MAG: hypothetical protein L3J07_03190 [Candidatus Magasanikbacteria bacterium]|nr:hypothetical protein [Candidatus Magasanikbacteria bacterium]
MEEYHRFLEDILKCNSLELENLIVQLTLFVESYNIIKGVLQDDLREICKTKVERFLFWIKENNGEYALFVKAWLQKFRELTEICYEEILCEMRLQGEV